MSALLEKNYYNIHRRLINGPSPRSVDKESGVDFALALQLHHQASSSCKIEYCSDNAQVHEVVNSGDEDIGLHVKGKETMAEGEDWCKNCPSDTGTDDITSFDRSKELRASPSDSKKKKPWGKDWWWRQDGSDELCAKDYVMDWIGSQIRPSKSGNWDDENKVEKSETDGTKTPEVHKQPSGELSLTESMRMSEKNSSKNKHKKFKEWWKEEYFVELNKKSRKLKLEKKWKRGKKFETWRDGCFSGDLSKGNSRRKKASAYSGFTHEGF